MIIEHSQLEMVKCLPHSFPFRFVDDVLFGDENIFVTEKKAEIFKGKPFHYPPALLIEHAAQTMFVHGYHIGLSQNWWDSRYQPTGFLTGLSNTQFNNVEIKPGDYILTKTEVVRICRPMLIVKTTISIYGQIVLFEGIINGVFTEGLARPMFTIPYETVEQVDNVYFKEDSKGTHFSSNNWFLPGHFPDFKCYPGCLMLEAAKQSIHPDLNFSKIKKARFKKVMTPDDKYYINTTHVNDNVYSFQVIEDSSEAICADGEFEVEM